jgi:very-short-patch-repair endonuclease
MLYFCEDCDAQPVRNARLGKESPAEAKLREALQDAFPVQFVQEYELEGAYFDFYFPRLKLLVEIDSSFHSGAKKAIRDKHKTDLAKKAGLQLVRLRWDGTRTVKKVLQLVRRECAKVINLGQAQEVSAPAIQKSEPSTLVQEFLDRWRKVHHARFGYPTSISHEAVRALEQFLEDYQEIRLSAFFKKVVQSAWKYSGRQNAETPKPLLVCEGTTDLEYFIRNVHKIIAAFRLSPEATLGRKQEERQSAESEPVTRTAPPSNLKQSLRSRHRPKLQQEGLPYPPDHQQPLQMSHLAPGESEKISACDHLTTHSIADTTYYNLELDDEKAG